MLNHVSAWHLQPIRGEAYVSRAGPIGYVREIGIGEANSRSRVFVYNRLNRTKFPTAASIQPESRFTMGQNRAHIVTDEQDGTTVLCHLAHLAQTFFLELDVTDSEHLVHHQDLRFEVGRDGERQSHVHSARVALDG